MCCGTKSILHSLLVSSSLIATVTAQGPPDDDAMPDWAAKYQRLPVKKTLRQRDFDKGTYRIREPGRYRLGEDITFNPRPDTDFWPEFGDADYPVSKFYLGFFSAITIETSGVWLDLNGHTIKQSDEHYLKQRFFSCIELNDGPFELNGGVSSLNLEVNDKLYNDPSLEHPRPGGQPSPPLKERNSVPKVASKTLISNGILGLSSHAGIHSNGAYDIVVSNLEVRDFEVTGIQCNGAKRVVIQHTQIGPSSKRVPVRGFYSAARFVDHYVNRLIPMGFSREGPQFADLLRDTISYADRPDQQMVIQDVFARLRAGLHLFERQRTPVSDEDEKLLNEAKYWFDNPSGLPDGGSMYGILLHRLGGAVDEHGQPKENYYDGTSPRVTKDVTLLDVKIVGLTNNPVNVPSLVGQDGKFMQGPTRDVIDIQRVVDDDFLTPYGEYRGTFLVDAVLAMWKLSNSYFKARVLNSPCGNTDTNRTSAETVCASQGNIKDTHLEPRDPAIITKRYFGGLALTQEFFDWATTPGAVMGDLFQPGEKEHYLVCGQDVMFHTPKGLMGVRADFAHDVKMKHVSIQNLVNVGEHQEWLCSEMAAFKLDNKLPVKATKFRPHEYQGADVRGITATSSWGLTLQHVTVENLLSRHGPVHGIFMDGNGVHSPADELGAGADLQDILIDHLEAGPSQKAVAVATPGMNAQFSSPSVSRQQTQGPILTVQSIGTGRGSGHVVLHSMVRGRVRQGLMGPSPKAVGFMRMVTPYQSDEQLRAFRRSAVKWLRSYYGVKIKGVEDTPLERAIELDRRGTKFSAGILERDSFHLATYCEWSTDASLPSSHCAGPLRSSPVIDVCHGVHVGKDGLTVTGTWGGGGGRWLPPGTLLIYGIMVVENPTMHRQGEPNLVIQYQTETPLFFPEAKDRQAPSTPVVFDYGLYSSEWGHGRGVGVMFVTQPGEFDGSMLWRFSPSAVQPAMSVRTEPVFSKVGRVGGLSFSNYKHAITWMQDGFMPVTQANAGVATFPATTAHHFVRGAGIEFLKTHTTIVSDADIRAMRVEFLERVLGDRFGIPISEDILGTATTLPLTATMYVPGGRVEAYVVNRAADFRSLSFVVGSGASSLTGKEPTIHEGGWRYVVGKGGFSGQDVGDLLHGDMILMGMYVIDPPAGCSWEREASFPSPLLPCEPLIIPFESDSPMKRTLGGQAVVTHTLGGRDGHAQLGRGRAEGTLQAKWNAERLGYDLVAMGQFVFDS
ncbi:unnamed protein product [Vitrella brassicaformis CCMP3155]|uniref:Uncharacterized protein n=4 Tax=Vitrella brassicaformis TaxID=1169539 RepID=A0A0G4FAA9_VITBC|nr:unnamed protein product [Vitrella brassicaformis CCMP3155]|eukprot:CEM09923.1 unnamed protein product [Vitrella brassicaformis CCMP3155]